MASLSIDTYKAVAFLQEQGYSKRQAEGFVAVIQDADLVDVATRADIAAVKDEIHQLDRNLQSARVEFYKVTAAQTLVIIGAIVAVAQAF